MVSSVTICTELFMVYFKAVNKSSPAQKGETMKIYKQNILQPNWDSN